MAGSTLVTGGTGLIGSALREVLPGANYVGRRDADLTIVGQVRGLFEKYRPERVVHLAARVAGVKTNAEKNADMFAVNAQINTNVLQAAQEFKVRKLVAALSNCVFRHDPPAPPSEKDVHVGMPFEGHLGYGFAKRMLDLQIQLLRKQYGCRFTSVTPVTVFGPHDNWDFNESHVAGSLIHKCFLARKAGKPLEVWGSGRAVRQFVYAGDVARALARVLESYDDPETVIIAPDSGTTIRELAGKIARAMDFSGPIQFNSAGPEGELVRVLDNAKFKKLFPDFKFTPLDEALRSTAGWFLEHAASSNLTRSVS